MKTPPKIKKPDRAPYHHGDLRRALIDATARLASREGLKSITLRKVAAAAQVSPAAPYHHFENKADLLGAVADEGFRRLDGALRRAAAQCEASDAKGQLRHMGRAYIQFAVKHPEYFRVMFRPEMTPAHPPDPESWGQRTYRRIIGVLQAIMGEQGEPSDAVLAEVVYAWTAVHGLASLWVDGTLSMEEPFAGWGVETLLDYIADRARVGDVDGLEISDR